MGNQVLRWAHWLAWAMDYSDSVGVVNMAFWPYAGFFEGSVGHPGCVYPAGGALVDRLAALGRHAPDWIRRKIEWRGQHLAHALGLCVPGVGRIGRRWENGLRIDLDGDDFWGRLQENRVTTCAGWEIVGWERLRNRSDQVRSYFRPAGKIGFEAHEFVRALRARFGHVIGVFIRQGDYMSWREGRFGYPTYEYVRWMRECMELEAGRGMVFLITSDTVQNASDFEGLPHVFSRGSANVGGPAITSFAELSQCDVILSPPSTFSATAAFVGGVPLWPLRERGQHLAHGQIFSDALHEAAKDPVCSLAVR